MQCKGKLVSQTWKNGEKLNSGPDFGPNLGSQIFLRGFYLW